jgi:hypothetical protein
MKKDRKFSTSYGMVTAGHKKTCDTKRESDYVAKGYRDKGWGLVRVVKSKDGYEIYARQSW